MVATGMAVTADMPTRAGMAVTATVVTDTRMAAVMDTGMAVTATITATGTLIRLITITTIKGMVTGGMVVGGAMASATVGVGRHTVMSGSAGTTDYSLRPSGLPSTSATRHGLTECT